MSEASVQDIVERYFGIAGNLPLETEVADGNGERVELGDGIRIVLDAITASHQAGNTLRFVGNGGSASIASHMAVDFAKRGGIRASALNDPAMLTCLGNDLGFDQVFARQLALHGRTGDVLVSISSSGQSPNILSACQVSQDAGAKVFTFSGFSPDNPLWQLGNINFYVASPEYGFVELTHMALLSAMIDILVGWRPEATAD